LIDGTSWTHLLARPAVRPLVGTWVRPNHLTTLRLLTGVAACLLFAQGTPLGLWWGGGIWLLSAFLDRADGELARIGNMMSRGGHVYDYYADTFVNAAFFVAAGIGLRHSWLGGWAIGLGLVSGIAMFLCSLFAEWLELRSPPGTRAYAGKWGFDPDDALYLLAPLAWLGWLGVILVGASIGATLMMVITGVRLLRLRRAHPAAASAGEPLRR
jgi:phosphatidylglycerophosphate synthase